MKSLPPIVAILGIVLLLIGGYVGAYLWIGSVAVMSIHHNNNVPLRTSLIMRTYDYNWSLSVFAPAAWIESKLRGVEVRLHAVAPHARRKTMSST